MQVSQSNDDVYTDGGCCDLIRTDLFHAGARRVFENLPRVTQCMDVWNSSDWCSDPVSSHSNETIRELTNLTMWMQSFIVSDNSIGKAFFFQN